MGGEAVLVDTNVILEAHRTSSWRALSSRYPLETAETCVEETQTGAQRRRPEQRIDEAELRGALKAVHQVAPRDRAAAALRDGHFATLDPGERDLWAHAIARDDAWVLCGPDKASLRLGVRLGLRDRLVALEALLEAIGFKARDLKRNYTKKWHAAALAELALQEGIGPA